MMATAGYKEQRSHTGLAAGGMLMKKTNAVTKSDN